MFRTILKNSINNLVYSSRVINNKLFFTSSRCFLKEIVETKVDKKIVLEGKTVPSPWEQYLLKSPINETACSVCNSDLDIKHTDVLILGQFVRSDGCMLPRRITGLCKLQQKRIATMVAMAQKAGLMSNIAPANSKQNPKLRKKWKKYNTYFDESTIRSPKGYRKSTPKLRLI